MLHSDIKKALVIGCFCISPITLWSDTVVYANFADAAACVVVSAEDEEEKSSKRAEIKELIRQLEQVNPSVAKNIFRSVENVNLATVIAYKKDGVKHHFLEDYDSHR